MKQFIPWKHWHVGREIRCGIGVLMLGSAWVLLPGCSEQEAAEPPLSEIDLVERCLVAAESGHYQESLVLLEKLRALDPENVKIDEMKQRLVANLYVVEVQKLVDAGKVKEARKLLVAARREHPFNFFLTELERSLVSLIQLQMASVTLQKAVSISQLEEAIAVTETLLATHPGAVALQKDLEIRKQDLSTLQVEAQAAAAAKASSSTKTLPESTR